MTSDDFFDLNAPVPLEPEVTDGIGDARRAREWAAVDVLHAAHCSGEAGLGVADRDALEAGLEQ